MRNQPPWRYQNFTLQQNDILPGAFNILGWPMHLPSHYLMHAHHLHREYHVKYSIQATTDLPHAQMIPGINGDTIHVDSMVDFGWGEWTKGYLV